MRIAIVLSVCQGEFLLGLESALLVIRSFPQDTIHLFLVDDGSTERVGERIAHHLRDERATVHSLRMPRSLGYHGGTQRTYAAYHAAAQVHPAFDVIVKLDPDSVVLRPEIRDLLVEHCAGKRGIWGELYPMRWQLRLKVHLDLLPFGLRKKYSEGRIQTPVTFDRFYKVWWHDIGKLALKRGFPFVFTHGGFYAIGGPTLKAMADAGYFARPLEGRHGLYALDEDVLIGLLVRAVDDPILDFRDISESFGRVLALWKEPDLAFFVRKQPLVVHPLKRNGHDAQLRTQLEDHFPHLKSVRTFVRQTTDQP